MSRRVYIALFAVLVELVAVAATGNQGVTNFVNRTFSLFETAKSRRPKTLLVAKKR